MVKSPLYAHCYYPDTSFQKFQAHCQFIAETSKSKSQSLLPQAVMDPSALLNSKATNNSSIKRTNVMEHMRSPTVKRNKSPSKQGEFCHSFLPPFGSGLDLLSAAKSKSVSPRKLNQYTHQFGPPSNPTPHKKSYQSCNISFWLPKTFRSENHQQHPLLPPNHQ